MSSSDPCSMCLSLWPSSGCGVPFGSDLDLTSRLSGQCTSLIGMQLMLLAEEAYGLKANTRSSDQKFELDSRADSRAIQPCFPALAKPFQQYVKVNLGVRRKGLFLRFLCSQSTTRARSSICRKHLRVVQCAIHAKAPTLRDSGLQ